MIVLCNCGWPGAYYVCQIGLELTKVYLPLAHECWDKKGVPLCFLPLRCLYSALPDSASFQRRPLLPGRNATGKKWDCHLIQVLHRAAQSRPSPLHPSTEMRLPGGPSPTYFLSPPFEIFYFLHSDLFTPPHPPIKPLPTITPSSNRRSGILLSACREQSPHGKEKQRPPGAAVRSAGPLSVWILMGDSGSACPENLCTS